ncbi:peptidoglycan-recognition protein LC isoform X2 [Anabrus simplex]|uniref:peptidoglycan-recognition protein LC isoform X2 n=1 Tax=Anabrus simplex TaxID=316456 RepID=UPI0035A2B2A2
MGDWRHQGDGVVEGAVVNLDNEAEEEAGDSECDSDSDTVSTSYGGDEDITTDSPGQALALAVAKKGEVPSFGNIAVNNSTDVHFGNKTFYNGPVTIKQFVYATSVDESATSPNANSRPHPFSLPNSDQLGATPSTEVTAVPPSASSSRLEDHKSNGNAFPVPLDPVKSVYRNECLNGRVRKIRRRATRRLAASKKLHVKNRVSQEQKQGALCLWARGLTKSQQVFYLVAAACVLVLLVTLVIVLATSRSTGPSSKSRNGGIQSIETVQAWDRNDTDFTPADKLRMIPRREWLAQPVGRPLDPLHHPVPYVIISHSATEQCELQAACTLQVRLIQTFHIESKGWFDIGYNFLVGGDGYCYVGRGWDSVGAHAFGYNNRSIGINFIGTFNDVLPPKKQLRAAKLVIEEGVKLGKIAPDYKLLAHRQVSGTESPGKRLYKELQTWPHWEEKP